MKELYDIYDITYENMLKQKCRTYMFKIEILDHWEEAFADITRYVSGDNSGQISVTYQQGQRRTCSLAITNVDNQFTPSEDRAFWYNRKFKIYIGVTNGDVVYWWSQGVFISQSVSYQDDILSLQGVDKFGMLDGANGLSMCDVDTIVPIDSDIKNVITSTISSDMGNGIPIDTIQPYVDLTYADTKTQAEINISAGNYIGEILKELAIGYSADIFYDRSGHLNFSNLCTDNRIGGYKYLSPQWWYRLKQGDYITPNIEVDFDGANAITVYTNATNFENVSVTVKNENPQSPLRVSSVGLRWLPSEELKYTIYSKEKMEDVCREYGKYLLFQQSLNTTNITFNSPLIPHLDVNEVVFIENEDGGDNYIVQSINFSIGVGEMQITACNNRYLDDDAWRWHRAIGITYEPTAPDDYIYEIIDNEYVAIIFYIGTSKSPIIPDQIENLPVKVLYETAFNYANIKMVQLPSTIEEVR